MIEVTSENGIRLTATENNRKEIRLLIIANNILFSEDDYEKFSKYSVAAPVKAMCLLISQDCNLRCEYCFASTGDYGKG